MAGDRLSIRELGFDLAKQIPHQRRAQVPRADAVHPGDVVDVELLPAPLLADVQGADGVALFVEEVEIMETLCHAELGSGVLDHSGQLELPVADGEHRFEPGRCAHRGDFLRDGGRGRPRGIGFRAKLNLPRSDPTRAHPQVVMQRLHDLRVDMGQPVGKRDGNVVAAGPGKLELTGDSRDPAEQPVVGGGGFVPIESRNRIAANSDFCISMLSDELAKEIR